MTPSWRDCIRSRGADVDTFRLLCPPTHRPAHNREFALGANSASFRLATSLGVYALTLVILGMFALYAIIARTRARRSALVGLVVIVVGAGCLLPGTGYATFMMPAAGILISQGQDQEVLLLFDQVSPNLAGFPSSLVASPTTSACSS